MSSACLPRHPAVAHILFARRMRSERITLHLHDVRIVGTGMDGGHTYIHGKASYESHGTVDAWAYFDFEDRAKEEDFERRYRGGDLEVESASWDCYPSTGLSLHNIGWKNVGDDATSNA
jgi:hypothetical protein